MVRICAALVNIMSSIVPDRALNTSGFPAYKTLNFKRDARFDRSDFIAGSHHNTHAILQDWKSREAFSDIGQKEHFVYSPLTKSRGINLLYIDPGKENSPIAVSLFDSLRQKRWYEAGRDRMHMRSKNERRPPYRTDTICIDQEDNKQKNGQVSMMGNVYLTCSRCPFWLGKVDNKAEKAFKLPRKMEIKARDALKVQSMDASYPIYPYTF